VTTLSDLKQKLMKRPEFRQEYEKAEAEYRLIEDAARVTPKDRTNSRL
jgi:hypothetical protein